MCQLDANGHGQIRKGDEWHDVDGAHTRMLTAVLIEVDSLYRHACSRKGGRDGELRLGYEGDHHPVVSGVSLDIDHPGTFPTDCVGDGVDDLTAPALREVWNALDELAHAGAHTRPPATVASTRFTPT